MNLKKYQHLCLGLAIIDFEHWRPIFDENFGSLSPYKEYSMEIEKYNHPYWQKEELKKEVSIYNFKKYLEGHKLIA